MSDLDDGEMVKSPGSRAQSRDSLMMSATIRRAGSETPPVPMRVRNMSSGGLMGEAEIALKTGEGVELSLKSVGEIEGTVAWSDDGRFGIAFAVAIDRLRVRRNVSAAPARATQPPRSHRPGVRTVV